MKEGTQEQHAEVAATIHAPRELGATSAPVAWGVEEEFEDDPVLDAMLAEAQGVPWESTASPLTDPLQLTEGDSSSEPTEGKKVPGRAPASVDKFVEKSRARTSKPRVDDAAPAKEPTPFQRMFGALVLACELQEDTLTALVRGRIGKAARSLLEAKYTAEDVPSIVAWIRVNETWRTHKLTAQVIEECAPSWKAAVPGNVPLTPKATGATPAQSDARRRYEERYA